MDFLSIEFCKPTNKKRMKTNHRRPFCTPKPILVPTVFVPLDQRSENERLWENTTVKCQACANGYIFGSQQPRPRGSLLSCAGKIGTPGQVQRHSGFEWLCKHNRLRPERSDLTNLTLSMRRVTGSPWIADFRIWTWPEVAIPVANQKDRALWERDWAAGRQFPTHKN